MPDRATFIADHWRAYIKINEQFAEKTVHALQLLKQETTAKEKCNSPPIVWVHDYHLMLAANWIRQVGLAQFNCFYVSKRKKSDEVIDGCEKFQWQSQNVSSINVSERRKLPSIYKFNHVQARSGKAQRLGARVTCKQLSNFYIIILQQHIKHY